MTAQSLHATVRVGWKTLGHQAQFRARIVNYADDFVILCRGRADKALTAMQKMMQQLKLTVNEYKTPVCRTATASFDFLRHTFGRMYSPRTGGAYQGTRPAKKKVQSACRRLNAVAAGVPTFAPEADLTQQVNNVLRGWVNYFNYGTLGPADRVVHRHAVHRVRQWLGRKFKIQGRGYYQFSYQHLAQQLGLLNLVALLPNSHTRKPASCPRAGCGKTARPVR